MRIYRGLIYFLFFFVCSCKQNTQLGGDKKIEFDKIIENDTISVNPLSQNLNLWLSFYKKTDSNFNLSNFKASGVILHMLEMKKLDSISSLQHKFEPLFEFSPDKKSYIDIWSYGHSDIPDSAWNSRVYLAKLLINGEADQQVVLGSEDGQRFELMYNGPSVIAEMAEWINNEQFLISLVSEENNKRIFELFLFDTKEKIYTNYRLDHTFDPDIDQGSFLEHWISETDKLIK